MGQNGVSSSQIRESAGDKFVDFTHEEQRLLEGPRDNGSWTDLDAIKGEVLHLINGNHVDAITGVQATVHSIAGHSSHSLNGDGNCLRNPGDNPEEDQGLLNQKAMKLTSIEAQGSRPNSRTEREETSVPKLDVSLLRANFDLGRLNAHAQETWKLLEDVTAAIQEREFQLQEQKQLVFKKEEEVSTLKRENQKLHELLITQVMELQETHRVIKHAFGELRWDVNNVPPLRNDIRTADLANTVKHLFHAKLVLDEDNRKCRIQLDYATQQINLKASESEQLTANIKLLAEARSKLEEKVEKIQQELCKEKAGHSGSYVDGSQTPFLWESTAKEMYSLIAGFSGLLSKYKDSKGDNPAHTWIVGSDALLTVGIARYHHWTYLLKRLVCDHLFHDFEYEHFRRSSERRVLFLNQEERASKCFEYFQKSKTEGSTVRFTDPSSTGGRFNMCFFHYFRSLSDLLPPEIQELCEAYRDYDELIATAHNRTKSEIPASKRRVLVSFIIAAKKVWDFHKLCLSFDSPATIFEVSQGDPFNPDYMESIDTADDCDTVPTVGFMVYPGFRLRKSIIKCQVYLAAVKTNAVK
ncbi:unnamed protein product [Calypogeia fissa]